MAESEDKDGNREEENFEPNGRIVSMVLHGGYIYIATEKRVFKMVDDIFTPVKFILPKN